MLISGLTKLYGIGVKEDTFHMISLNKALLFDLHARKLYFKKVLTDSVKNLLTFCFDELYLIWI